MTSQPRHPEPLPLGGDGCPVLEGPDGARADRAVGVPTMRAHELARRVEEDLALAARRRRPRPDRGARRRRRRRWAACAGTRAARARPAGDRPARRRDRDRQVDGRDRARVPARDHARDVDRLHPPDDARVLLARVHAVDPLLELRGRAALREPRGGGRPRDRRLPRPDAQRARRRAARRSTARSRRAGRWCSRASTSCPARRAAAGGRAGRRRPVRPRDRGPAVHETHFYVRDASSDGVRPCDEYLDRFDEIRRIQDEIVARARRESRRRR